MLPPDYFSPKNGEGHTTRQNIRNPATTTTASVAPTTRGRGRCDGRRVNSLPLEHPPGRHGCGSVPPSNSFSSVDSREGEGPCMHFRVRAPRCPASPPRPAAKLQDRDWWASRKAREQHCRTLQTAPPPRPAATPNLREWDCRTLPDAPPPRPAATRIQREWNCRTLQHAPPPRPAAA
eukprot:gene16794-biopygen15850